MLSIYKNLVYTICLLLCNTHFSTSEVYFKIAFTDNPLWHMYLPLARQINCRLLNFLSASTLKVLKCGLKLVKTLSECQRARIRVRVLGVSSGSKLLAYGTIIVIGGLRVNKIK